MNSGTRGDLYKRWVDECKDTVHDLRACVKQVKSYQQQCWGMYRAALCVLLILEQTVQTVQTESLDLKEIRDLPDLFAAATSAIEFAWSLLQVVLATWLRAVSEDVVQFNLCRGFNT